jgi:hypothetical protein
VIVVTGSSRKVRRVVGGVLVALLMLGLLGVIRPAFIYECPCGTFDIGGFVIGCWPCWAAKTPTCQPTRLVLR